jgi:uncharacterized protein YjeT (DUF2065 family)
MATIRPVCPVHPACPTCPAGNRKGLTDVTPWQRALRVTGVAVVVLGVGAVEVPYGSAVAYGAGSAPEAVTAREPEPSRAGSRAGEGRERPGRREAAEENQDGVPDVPDGVPDGDEGDDGGGDATAVPEESQDAAPVPSAHPRRPARQAAARAEEPAEPVLRLLPLGSGLVLIGLGLGLAFLGLRLRRT